MPVTMNVSYPADGVAVIAFGDPPMNFGGIELAARIMEGVQAADDAGSKVFVLASDTPGYFIAHWSLQFIIDAMAMTPPSRPPARQAAIFEAIGASRMISIAANNGQAWGGGAELSWGCDLRIAAESATYGQPEVALGIPPGAGGTTRLARLIGPTKCLEMILDGRPITAREAHSLGAVNKVVPDDRLRDEAIAWAAHIAQWPAWSLDACKRSFRDGMDLPLEAARRSEQAIFQQTARRPDALALMAEIQAKYNAGADSYEAAGIPRLS
ncbi:MAG: enoyl-CoA hydratase/isomerase family protein [Chloroflexi bacterium]|nr:enoyl-CoA hydratase/isomerase family protein [Chloroflexota bacterium]MDA1004052.1 enoyl-CoA hydratase/isomerase family protein [Chloroflexota bacterium]